MLNWGGPLSNFKCQARFAHSRQPREPAVFVTAILVVNDMMAMKGNGSQYHCELQMSRGSSCSCTHHW